MSATARATITLHKPLENLTGDDALEREQRMTEMMSLQAWAIAVRAERTLHTLGALTDRAMKFRFRAPRLHEPIRAGWEIEHEGERYAVRSATNIAGLWSILAERVG